MKKFFICISLALTGLMTSCIEKYEEVDADTKPSWLGGSIYAELKNPDPSRLEGTFNTYLRLVDDLGYAETLDRTGSKTVFPANDEAFSRFFAQGGNEWGVTDYNQLSEAQKKQLLYASMLDNALLLNMLPNVSNGTAEPMKGRAIKHATNASVIDTIQHIANREDMPKNNAYWEKFYETGIDVVRDNTRPMMVHLTREYMLQNDITTLGDQSDFAILTGTPFTEGTAYIFNDRVINGDITCQNGYIHQMEDVIVPPGNMAQVLRKHANTKYFNRILDYFAVPYYDESTTRNYNDWAMTNGLPLKDSIYQVRYLSSRSQGGEALRTDPNRTMISTTQLLGYDPGWNQYYPNVARAGNTDVSIMDLGAFFVPEDEAVEKYFLPGGTGAYLIDIYGDRENTAANLAENLDSLHSKNPLVLTSFTKNLMKARFTETVPSKFSTVLNDASEVMGLDMNMLKQKADGRYDITIANNGVVYLLNEMIAPDEYQAVLAPSSVYPDMQVMKWAVQDRGSGDYHLGVDFRYYLLAMSANYAFFIPDDAAFDLYYLDPTSMGHVGTDGKIQPDVLHFYYDSEARSEPRLKCDRYFFDTETGEAYGTARSVNLATVRTQLVDILNYHTLVLNPGEVIGKNHYLKTKHGGTVYVDGNVLDGRVMSGEQYEGNSLFPAPQIKQIYREKNGTAYRINRVIQPPVQSVYSVINSNPQFSEFLTACAGFDASNVLAWAGISVEPKQTGMPSPQDAYKVFTRDYKLGSTSIEEACLDYNVKMFNTFNYTLFAPDNTAMAIAYSEGLPHWTEIVDLFEKYAEMGDHEPDAAENRDKDRALKMIQQIRDFVRYHFVTNSVYADNEVEAGTYQTLSSDATGVAKEVKLSCNDGVLVVSDMKSGHSITVRATDTNRIVNKMTRDYWFNVRKTSANAIETSSFCAVHQISEPLYGNASGRFDN
ncbi:MAG: fasciclin domain-containing protein [Prevotella sp.]|nr:fasciclin domain-containing protein [Prevotella sp.]